MIQYNPKDWFGFIFQVHKGDTIRTLFPLMLALAIYSGVIVYLEREYFGLSQESPLKNITLMHGILGGVISLLLVFRTNSAYDRWWEGRKIWGDLTNHSRNLAIKLNVYLEKSDEENRNYFRKIIPAYAFALKNHLQSKKVNWELFDQDMGDDLLKGIDHDKHIPNQVADMMLYRVNSVYLKGGLTDAQFINLNDELRSFTNICGACERIRNTPIPFSYSVFIKKFIFGYIMTLPFGYSFSLGYLSIPIIVFVFYVLASLELIAEEIEDPFGGDTNDLPTDKMAHNIHHNVDHIFHEEHDKKNNL